MTRVVSVGRSHGLVVAGALGLALLTVTLTGCPGSLDNPNAFPPVPTGSAQGAAGTGAAGTNATGTAGSMGTAGTGAAGTGSVASCDVTPIFGDGTATKPGSGFCTLSGCHDATGSSGAFTLSAPGFQSHLVGVVPGGQPGVTGSVAPSLCVADATYKKMAYITKPTTAGGDAGGLILTKLKMAACGQGVRMPSTGNYLNATDMACVQKWANALAAAAP